MYIRKVIEGMFKKINFKILRGFYAWKRSRKALKLFLFYDAEKCVTLYALKQQLN